MSIGLKQAELTDEEIIRIAKQAGLVRSGDGWNEPDRWGFTEIKRLVRSVEARHGITAAPTASDA